MKKNTYYHTNFNFIDVNILKQNSEQVFLILLSNIKKDYGNIDINVSDDSIKEQDFILKAFISQIKILSLVEENKDKFLFIGYKILVVESKICTTCRDTLTYNTCNTWSNKTTRNTLNKKSK